eukprot:GEMP01015274.1.p1 GENE.GEMP01015274.1~~GEMP01015274.1.p1  ORF type:complete len:911 (+),score=205.02 GEMP01015274.1:238-2733(+)
MQELSASLEIEFWAKENIGMLTSCDAEFAFERIVEGIESYDASDQSDMSSNPRVIFLTLVDSALLAMLEDSQKTAIRETLVKYASRFPLDARNLWSQLKSMPVPAGMILPVVPQQTLLPALPAKPSIRAAPPRKRDNKLQIGQMKTRSVAQSTLRKEQQPEQEEAVYVPPPIWPMEELPSVPTEPHRIEKTRKIVMELVNTNNGMILREVVDRAMLQFNVQMPYRELSSDLWYSATDVYWRSEETRHVQLNTQECRLPPEMTKTIVEEVKRVRMVPLKELVDMMDWNPGSERFAEYGPLWVQLERIYELFYAPQVVFATQSVVQFIDQTAMMRHCRELYLQVQQELGPMVVDPFSEMCHLLLAKLQQSTDGKIHCELVNMLLKALQFKPKQLLQALKNDIFWSHPESEFDLLLRTPLGQQQHPDPLPDCYLPDYLHQQLIKEVKYSTGCKLSNLIGSLQWNRVSEHKKAYGTLRSVVIGMKELFFDPDYIYLKKSIDAIVEWPATGKGRFFTDAGDAQHKRGPQETMHEIAQKIAVEQVELPMQVRRLVLGTIMSKSGHCPAEYLDSTIDMQFGVKVSRLFYPGEYDMRNLLFRSTDRVFLRKMPEKRNFSIADVSEKVCTLVVDALRKNGSNTLEELKEILKDEMTGHAMSDTVILKIVSKIPEAFFEPEEIYLLFTLGNIIETEHVEEHLGPFLRSQNEEEPAAKRPRVEAKPTVSASSSTAPAPQWGEEAPAWVSAGVMVSNDGEVGVIVKVDGFVCTIRVGDTEIEVPVSVLRPVDPEVGGDVKIVDGPQRGVFGKLVGIAGSNAIVQIATSYETLPMRKVAASRRE